MRTVRTFLATLLLFAAGAGPGAAQPGAPLGTAQLQISGARLTLYSDALTTDAEQTINVGEAARVRTCYGAGAACGTAAPGSVPGLKVVGDLSGPELPQAIPYETVPGGTFFLPGFQREGDYLLTNIRLVETATGRVFANAEPSLATLHVRQILLASATVTRLTLADLQARGIALTQANFNAFSFAVGFVFSGTTVTIELPVLYEGNGLGQILEKPRVLLDGLPSSVANAVRRWEPPNIVPFQLNATGPRVPSPGGGGDDETREPEFPLYGAIILPGNVSFLNQFFDAKLIVANGAPNGSGATLENVTGVLKLPSGEVLRLAATAPPVAAGQKLPVLKANGQGALGPGEQAFATWTVEGLVPGTHVLRMDIEADLARPGRPVLATGGVVQAAVEVVDARFQLAFNHPDVVRTGEPYSLYVTVTNLSRATQNLVTVDLASQNISGAHKLDAQESFSKTIPTLEPGESETLEYKLVADVTGTCVATTFQAAGGLSGVIHLRAGVGEAGIPLSPAALVLPRFTNLLPKSLVDANVRFLGLAYSLATAPAGAGPAGLPHVVKSDVVRRAVDLGEAGQRLYLQDRLLESLEALSLDQLGNRDDLADYDTLRRLLERAAQASTALADLFRREQQSRNLAAADFVDHFASTMSYGRPWMSAALVPNGSQPAPTLEVRQVSGAGTTFLAYASDDPARLRTLPYGEVYAVNDVPGGTTKLPFALVGRLDPAASYRVDLYAPATAASGRLILVVPSDDLAGFRKVDFGFVSMNANEVWEVRAVKAAGDAALTFVLAFAGSGIPVPGVPAPSISNLALPPFRVIGAVQDPDLDRYGLGISYLFNRPPDKASAETPSSYVVKSSFHGEDAATPAVVFDKVVTKAGAAAFWQPNSERVVNVRYQTPISALNGIFAGQPVIRHEHLLVTNAIRDTHGTPLDPQVPDILIDPNRTGGLVDGRVLRGDGTPAAGARVQLLRYRKVSNPDAPDHEILLIDLVAEVSTGTDGAFYFDFIEEPPPPGRTIGSPPRSLSEQVQSGFVLQAIVPAGADPVLQPEEREQVSTKIRLQNRLLHVNIALLGRGTVKGTLVYQDNGAPATDGSVAAASTLFLEQRSTPVASDGSFTFGGLPVGPITLSGRDGAGNRVYETVGIQRPGDVVNVTLRLGRTGPQKTGTVAATVLRLRSGSPPVVSPGAAVAVYAEGHFIEGKTSDSLGNATFRNVPAGRVSVQAADFSISRTPAITDLTLAADATVTATLVLADAAPRSVIGRVLFHDGPTNTNLPVPGAVAFITGPGVFAYTDATGTYRIDGVPVQAAGAPTYILTAFDNVRGLQGQTPLPPVVEGDGSPILAADILLVSMSGGIDGVVLDPLGRTAGGIAVTLGNDQNGNEIAASSAGDGRFSFDDIAVGSRQVFAHVGDGLTPGRVGYFGQATAKIVFGGHRPFVTIRMAGSGVVNVRTRTSASQGVLSPIFYRPTVYANAAIKPLGGSPIETSTDPDGRLTLVLPVGPFALTAVNPLNGNKSLSRTIDYPGQVINLDIVFDTASTVTGRVVGVDGVTPVPNADVSFSASGLLPQAQRTDGQGAFRYELVPQGRVSVTAAALVGSVERVGRADGYITGPGQTLDLTVVMKAQGTVRGQVVDLVGSLAVPLAFAQYYVQESGYPNRRLPVGTGFFSTDAQGIYEVAHVFAGGVTVVARDRNQVTRQGSARGEITADFQVLTLPDVVISTSVGSLGVTVRDPDSGGPVADAQVTLSNGDMTVADANGQASFDALPLGTYSVHAFHAPTGRGGLTTGLRLQAAGDRVDAIVLLDTRGQILGTLFDDPGKTAPVGGGTILLTGRVNGRSWGTSISALATTSSDPVTLGRFLFDGIPPGSFDLAAGVATSPRRAAAALTTTPTAPVVSVDLVLEPVADRFVRLFESLTSGVSEVNPGSGVYALTLTQPWSCPPCTYTFTVAVPSSPYPGHLFSFPAVLTSQSLKVAAQESSGEQRTGSIDTLGGVPGAGTSSDPYRLVLRPKGRVTVTVRDALNQPAQASVTIDSSGRRYAAATDASGQATFDAVLSGTVYASARVASTGFGGTATGTLTFDDQTLSLSITLAAAVSAHGVVYRAPAGDLWDGNLASLTPEPGAIVSIVDSGQLQVVAAASDGSYRFEVLHVGQHTISASDATGQAFTSATVDLAGPNGNDNALPPLVLDASRPLIVSIVPPPGSIGISRNAPVEIAFSEPLLATVLPTGGSTSPYFTLRSATGNLPGGAWTALLNGVGQQVVRFTPSGLYENSTVYSVTIAGGPSGVRDRAGRPLSDSGNVGSNFTTSDTVGPGVVGTTPSLDRPVDPIAPIRFDFSEVVTATPQELDGSGPTPAAQLFWQQNGSSVWQPIPISMFLTRGGYSLTIEPPTGVTYSNDSLQRRVHVSRLKDSIGNAMADYDKAFRIYDQNPPHVDASFPASAPTGQLVGGTSYTLTPVLSNLDDLPQGDVDRVEYFLASAGDPATPASTPAFTARSAPWIFTFVAAYAGNGIDPRPFPVWVKGVDTSTNPSNVVKLAMNVLPNAPPVIASVAASATAPVAGTFHAGSSLAAQVAGVADPDGSTVTLTAELRKDNPSSPNDPADLVASLPSQPLTRPGGGWSALAPPVFTSAIPISMADGTSLFFRVKATDALGASVTAESARFAVAHDPNAPVVDSFVARLSGASSPASQFFIGQKLLLEFRARDAETAVRTTSIAFSGVFSSPQAATLVGGTTNLYRTGELTVPATVPPGGLSVTATAAAADWGGNTGTLPLTFTVTPTPDPYAPVVTWLTPWEGGGWPSSYTSTVSPQGAALLLRVKVADLDRIGGLDVPGSIASVQFKGPVDAGGTLASTFVDGSLVAGTGGPGAGVYEALWRVPNGVALGTQLPFQVRVVDAGANATSADAHLRSVRPRKVYEATQVAALPADTLLGGGGDAAGPVFLLDGAVLSLYPQTAPAVRMLPAMYVYAGGVVAGASFTPSASILTAPEVTSYASSVLYNPLELTVTDTFGVGHGARVDVTAKGLLGSTPTQSMVLPGQIGSQIHAGGSHGGSGGPGSPGGWTRTDLTASGSVYDSAKDPALPGGGGGYGTGGTGTTPTAGGTGGGVVRLLAPGATVHLGGDVFAGGGDGPGGFSGGGGAGGTIRIVAGRFEGLGTLSAEGGRGTIGNSTGGGGGGRIALSFADPPAASLPLTVGAPGGLNSLPPDSSAQQIGGAGTVYLEELDALGAPKAPGRLIATNASGKPAWPTPISGPQRFGSVEGRGAARLVFDEDLAVGPVDPGALNDRASVSLDAEARLLLKGEVPQISITAAPDGGDVNVNQTLSLTWAASDLIGLFSLTRTFSPQAPATSAYADEPLLVTQGAGPVTLTVPGNQPPGPITYTLTATDRAGRVASVQKSWNVLPDTTPPAVSVTGLAAGGVYHAGQTIHAAVTATDNGAIASLSVLLDGQTFPLSGPGPTFAFSYFVPANLAAPRDTTFQAVAVDAGGNTTSTTPVAIHLLLDAAPSLNLTDVTPGPSLLPGAMIAATANASDDVAIATIVFTVSGAAPTTDTRIVNATPTVQSFSYRLPFTLTAGQTVTLQVDAFDSYGHKVSASPVTYTILADTTPPAAPSVSLAPVKPGDVYSSGDVITFTVTATDDVGIASIKLTVNGQVTNYTSSPAVLTFTAPPVDGGTPMSLDVEVRDYAGNLTTASRPFTVNPTGGGTYPVVQFSCPSDGAYLPSAYTGLLLTATATDSAGISRIEFYRPGDVTPFFTSTPSSGTPSPYTGTSPAVTLPTVATDTLVRYRARAYNPANHFTEVFVDIHAVPAVDIATATATDVAVLRSGTFVVDTPKTFAGLIVLRGATITHTAATGPGGEHATSLTVNGPVYVECGGAVDASAKGYPVNRSYPGATTPGDATGGSHLGYGGLTIAPIGSTFGSVYRPQEAGGGGGNSASSGGGIVRIVAGSVVVDGAIRANGGTDNCCGQRTGAGGSVWITAANVGGAGTIEARGGDGAFYGTGGGGAIAIEYTAASGTLLTSLVARTGSPSAQNRYGGAGAVYLKGPSAVYGDLIVDNSGIAIVQATELPSLGSGVALAGSSGATLVTDRAADIPAYYGGHWVEISDSSNVKKGSWRIGAIASRTVTLVPNASETISVLPGDKWQGVYRFDNVTLKGVRVLSADPIRGTAAEILGSVEMKRVDSDSLTVKAGATLTHLVPAVGSAETLTLNVSGALTVEAGGAIDVTGRGYAPNRSYPGATTPGDATGGSHLGYGGLTIAPIGSTFGSVYRPQEAGGGGGNSASSGGGIVRIVAGSVVVDGAIRANGGTDNCCGQRTGAGGSVWITAPSVGGGGTVEARGGDSAFYGTGAGGAIAVEYTASSGTLLTSLVARTGSPSTQSRYGGAGTILLKGPAVTYGALIVDNGGKSGQATDLPSLGSGTAQAGSAGATLVTGRAANVPAYFAGHHVEISDASNVLKGTCRISTAPGSIVNTTVTLDSCSPALTVDVGDKWQGVYRFDQLSLANGASLASADLIQISSSVILDGGAVDTLGVTGTVEVRNSVAARRINAQTLTVKTGGTLTHPATPAGGAAESLTVNLTGALTVEAGGAIDVTGRGYAPNRSYPGATTPGDATGGSHLGYGGLTIAPIGSTFGSVYRPQEAGGGGGNSASSGGGIVRLVAGSVVVDGAILANGGADACCGQRTGAGGSVWIMAANVGGAGTIEARGGDGAYWGAGGGGAIAIEYASSGGTILANLVARTGSPSAQNKYGGAGTILLKGPAATYGALIVDNGGKSGQATELPSLGNGTAQAGSAGATLVTGRAVNIPAYFAAHYVEISDSSNVLKGTCRISTAAGGIVATTVTLDSCSPGLAVSPGDKWQGVYPFDSLSNPSGTLVSADPLRFTDLLLAGATGAGVFTEVGSVGATNVTVTGHISATSIAAASLTVKSGAILTQTATTASATNSLTLSVSGPLTIESGASIDLSGRGYPSGRTYPGVAMAGTSQGGSHIGNGGFAPAGLPYGSLDRPAENGAGNGTAGGGALRLLASSVSFGDATSAIRANGGDGTTNGVPTGAGGSIWITVSGAIAGDGKIEARGGNVINSGAGGGGAVRVEHGGASGVWPSNVLVRGGSTLGGGVPGGAGTASIKGPASSFGNLAVDNAGLAGTATLPSLGGGVALAGSSGGTLVLDKLGWVPPYVGGRFIEIHNASGSLKGAWRVSAITPPASALTFADLMIDTQPGLNYDGYFLYSALTLSVHFGGSAEPGFGNSHVFAARFNAGQWQYDNKSVFVNFTPDPSDRVFASFHKSSSASSTTVATTTCPGAACGSVNGIPVLEMARARVRPYTFVSGNPDASNSAFLFQDLLLSSEPYRLTLEAPADVQPGDAWQAVHRFDGLDSPAGATIVSGDPIRLGASDALTLAGPAAGTAFLVVAGAVTGPDGTSTDLTVTGRVALSSITVASLTVKTGAVLSQPATTASTAGSLAISLTGALTVESGAAIDVTGRGYPAGSSYPGAVVSGGTTGGSHVGLGGGLGVGSAHTFGSVTRPQENGAGAGGASPTGIGGGSIRISAGSVTLTDSTSAVRANGTGGSAFVAGGAGGSVWITAGTVSGSGKIEARGWDAASSSGAGGGGAVAIEYGSLSAAVQANLSAFGGTGSSGGGTGGPGTVYLKGPSSTLGDVIIDNGGRASQSLVLPAFGSGTALAGTTGVQLVTDRASTIPAFFAGHSVEITDSSGTTLKGTCRISTASGGIADRTVILDSCTPAVSVAVGDKWQGVYRFDTLTSPNGASIASGDPIRLGPDGLLNNLSGPTAAGKFLEYLFPINGTDVTVTGNVSVPAITATSLTLKPGATLAHPASTAASPQRLTVTLSGALTLESGARIDVSARGYPGSQTYPGASIPGLNGGGSHIGTGAGLGGSTFGSVYRPSENGGAGGFVNGCGATCGSPGGGVVRVVASTVSFADATSAIRANGAVFIADGAGGSIWVTASGAITGPGSIEVLSPFPGVVGGGGGAIALEYGAGTVAASLVMHGGNNSGTGTAVLKGPLSTFGDLIVDSGGVASQTTALPSLGSGTALAGTAAPTLVTDRAVNIPAYFAGHWVEISDSSNVLKGACQISTAAGGIVNKTVTLVSCSSAFTMVPGDKWQGIYRFDNAPTTAGGAALTSIDPIRIGGALLRASPADLARADSARELRVRSVSICSDAFGALKPGSSFAVCADTDARDVTLEISGAFEARVASYGNCRDPIAIPGSAKPGPLKIVATARDVEGRSASATARGLVVADELAPVLVSIEPAASTSFQSGDPLRIAVDTWDDVGIASVAITLGGKRTILTSPPFEIRTLAPPVASSEALPVLVEVFDPSGNVSRRALDLGVLPAGTRLPSVAASVSAPGVSFEDGRLAVDGGWPWRDADGEARGRTIELPAIGTHTVLAVDGANGPVVAVDGPVARAAVHGGAVDVHRGGEFVGRFRILSVSEDGLVLRLEGGAAGSVSEGDFLEGNWAFDSIELTRGAILRTADVVEARTIHVDASSLFLSKNLQIPSTILSSTECPSRGARPDPPGTAPTPSAGGAP